MTRTAVGGAAATVEAHGIRIVLPERWEARLFLRDLSEQAEFELVRPVLHAANFALPPARGDFGTGAVEVMRADHAFVALVEYGAAEGESPLFAARGLPRLRTVDFAPNALQRRLPGQLGCQRFFTTAGRAFCLYVVLGARQHAADLVGDVQRVLSNVTVRAT